MSKREQIYSDIPEELSEAEDLLCEYGRWARGGGGGPAGCGSAERMYRSKQDDEDRRPSSVQPPRVRIDKINRALQQVPERWRLMLMWVYVSGPLTVKLRAARIPARTARELHLEGVRMFWNNWKSVQRYENRQPVDMHSIVV